MGGCPAPAPLQYIVLHIFLQERSHCRSVGEDDLTSLLDRSAISISQHPQKYAPATILVDSVWTTGMRLFHEKGCHALPVPLSWPSRCQAFPSLLPTLPPLHPSRVPASPLGPYMKLFRQRLYEESFESQMHINASTCRKLKIQSAWAEEYLEMQ